jgi:hypothetical protein
VRVLLFTLGIIWMLASCEPYEPVVMKSSTSSESAVEECNEAPPSISGSSIKAYASGAEYVLYFASEGTIFKPLYQGTKPFTANIEIPEHAPLDLWLVTLPATQDSVQLHVGCIQIKTVNRVRMVVKN